jgi:hypothetical protein
VTAADRAADNLADPHGLRAADARRRAADARRRADLGPDDREDRLPVWARERLHLLRLELDGATTRAEAAELAAPVAASSVMVASEYRAPWVGLGPHPIVRVLLDDRVDADPDRRHYAEVRRTGSGRLEVHGGGPLTLHPRGSVNVIEIEVTKR